MISLIFIILASVCNAIMDNLSHHWSKSKFNKLNPYFWNPELSWKNKYTLSKYIPDTLTDAWHIFKGLMATLICFSIVLYTPMINNALDAVIIVIFGILTFNLFYNHILVNKKNGEQP